jgi:hypothetical protein
LSGASPEVDPDSRSPLGRTVIAVRTACRIADGLRAIVVQALVVGGSSPLQVCVQRSRSTHAAAVDADSQLTISLVNSMLSPCWTSR